MSRRKDAEYEVRNNEIYRYYYNRLVSAALSEFQWVNLPKTCWAPYFERRLLFDTTAAFFVPKDTDFWLSGGYVFNGGFDFYGRPTGIRGMGYNAENLEVSDFVVCYDNVNHDNLLRHIEFWAKQLYEVHQTYRSNLAQQTTPWIVTGPKRVTLSLQEIIRKITHFSPVVELSTPLDPEAIKTLDMRANFIGTDLLDNLKACWAEALTMLGIIPQQTKRERMVTQELMINQMEPLITLNSRLRPRVDFCNEINERFNLNISVNLSVETPELVPYMDPAIWQLAHNIGDDIDARTQSGEDLENDG